MSGLSPSPDDLLRELVARASVHRLGQQLLAGAFPEQQAFILDPSRLKASVCTRRSGKSYGCAIYLLKEAQEHPGSNGLFIGLTRKSAKRIAWKVLRDLCRRHGLGGVPNETDLTLTFPNGSTIYLLGLDAAEDEKEKILGSSYRLVVIDESASFTVDLRDLVEHVIEPATVDAQGTVAMVGVPGNVKQFYYEVTSGKVPGWSVHRWSASQNPHVKKQWEADLGRKLKDNPLFQETTVYQQEWLGHWVLDESKLVYKGFNPGRNSYRELPPGLSANGWHFIGGLDLGLRDASAMVILAYHDHDPHLYVVDCWKERGLDANQVADRVRRLQALYDLELTVCDPASAQVVKTIENRYPGVRLRAAEKTSKLDHIAIMSDEFVTGKILLHREKAQPYALELSELVWDERQLMKGKKVEHPRLDNHLCDAALYAWRYAYTWLAEQAPSRPAVGSPEYLQAREQELEAAFLRAARRDADDDLTFGVPAQGWSIPDDGF